MAEPPPPIHFEDVPLDEARRMGRGPRMEPMLYDTLRPSKPSSSIRMDARLDVTTWQKVDDLATRFMLCLDDLSQTKLQQLIKQFGASKAEVIRHHITQAKPEDFPPRWPLRAAERRLQQPRQSSPLQPL